MQAQDHGFREQRDRFIIEIPEDLRDLRHELDEACLVLFGKERYDEYLGQNTQVHHPKLDRLIELVTAAEVDPMWRERLVYFAERLDAVANESLLLAGAVRSDVVRRRSHSKTKRAY
jgi:hypothetical protein